MVLGAIDIGSNGIILQIIRVIKDGKLVSFKKLEYIRFPLGLGRSVFKTGHISEEIEDKFLKLMETFQLMMELYEVKSYLATATSAMREADNSPKVVNEVKQKVGLEIKVIPGEEEAKMLSKAIVSILPNMESYVHIDVGGGSTELNIYVSKIRIHSRSFKIGTVRKLKPSQRKSIFKEMKLWIEKKTKDLVRPITCIGTGGNIKKLFELSNKSQYGGISLAELKGMRGYLNEFSLKERIKVLKLNPDRADVIVPAAGIYIDLMQIIKSDHILVPNVGLKDGLLYHLYEQIKEKNFDEINFV